MVLYSYRFEAEKFWPRRHHFEIKAGWESWSVREVQANFDKYSSGNICELLAEYLSFVWKIFVAESDLRSACKSGSLVTGYLQMITGVHNANHSGSSTARDAAAVHWVRTLDRYRAQPPPLTGGAQKIKLRQFSVNLQICCKRLICSIRISMSKWNGERRGFGCQKVFFPFPRNLKLFGLTCTLVLPAPECRRSFGPVCLFCLSPLNLYPGVQLFIGIYIYYIL